MWRRHSVALHPKTLVIPCGLDSSANWGWNLMMIMMMMVMMVVILIMMTTIMKSHAV